jgi:hypothetical protein
MPGYRVHLAGGLVLYGITIYLLRSFCGSIFVAAEWLVFALVGSLFPDLDTKSKGQGYLYQILLIALIILAIQRKFLVMAFLSIAAVIPIIASHRGLFHSLAFIVGFATVVALIVLFYAPEYRYVVMFDAIFFIVGAFSHLSLDIIHTTLKGGNQIK